MAFITWEDTTSDGVQTTYGIIFPFLDRDHVVVKFNGIIQPTTAYTFLSDSQISLVSPATNGVTVRVQRITPQTVQTDYNGGTVLSESDLDNGYLQSLYHTQELQDLYTEAVAGSITADLPLFLQSGAGAVSRTFNNKVKEIVSVKDFGATGDGVTDDTVAIQAALTEAALSSGNVFVPAGTYIISTTLTIDSNVYLFGVGSGSVLKASSSLPKSSPILIQANIDSVLDTYNTVNIGVSNLKFDGGGQTSRTGELLSFSKVQGYSVTGCEFTAHDHIGLVDGGCYGGRVINNRFHLLGRTTAASPAIWAQSHISSLTPTRHLICTNNVIHDNLRSGVLFACQDSILANNVFKNNGESTIFISDKGDNIVISGNYIERASVTDISAHAIELGSNNTVISGNRIHDTDGSSITLTDCDNVVINGNYFSDFGVNTTQYPAAVNQNAIVILSTNGNTSTDISVVGNEFKRGASGGSHCVVINNASTVSAAPVGINIKDNNFRGGYSVSAIWIQRGANTPPHIGVDSRIENNIDETIQEQGGSDGREQTISSGAITIFSNYHTVDTESGAASDDLDTINGGNDGRILTLTSASVVRDIVIKDGTGNIILSKGDFTLTDTRDNITLIYDGTNWIERSRSLEEGMRTVASANSITVYGGEEAIQVTGSTIINNIVGGNKGQRLTILWAGAATFDVADDATGAGEIHLAGTDTNITTHTAGDTLDLVNNGTDWYEVGRSVNA